MYRLNITPFGYIFCSGFNVTTKIFSQTQRRTHIYQTVVCKLMAL